MQTNNGSSSKTFKAIISESWVGLEIWGDNGGSRGVCVLQHHTGKLQNEIDWKRVMFGDDEAP
jgi:hypothetical protein